MSEATFIIVKTTSDKIENNEVPIINGQMIFCDDTQNIYFDYDDKRKCYADVQSKTTAQWLEYLTYIPPKGKILIYEDYQKGTDKDGNEYNIPGLKIADGARYAATLPFITEKFALADDLREHINNNSIHVSATDRDFWNNKIRCYLDEDDSLNLVFTCN